MNATYPLRTEQADELPQDLLQLVLAIGELPAEQREQLDAILQKVVTSTRRRRRILNLVQEALGQLRLDMKYLVFDLEATRRERNQYRQSLDEQTESGEDDLFGGTENSNE